MVVVGNVWINNRFYIGLSFMVIIYVLIQIGMMRIDLTDSGMDNSLLYPKFISRLGSAGKPAPFAKNNSRIRCLTDNGDQGQWKPCNANKCPTQTLGWVRSIPPQQFVSDKCGSNQEQALVDASRVRQCLQNKRILWVGDSTQQEMFNEFVSYLGNDNTTESDFLREEWRTMPCFEGGQKTVRSTRHQTTSAYPVGYLKKYNITVDFVWSGIIDHCYYMGGSMDGMLTKEWHDKVSSLNPSQPYHADWVIAGYPVMHVYGIDVPNTEQLNMTPEDEKLWHNVIPKTDEVLRSFGSHVTFRSANAGGYWPKFTQFNQMVKDYIKANHSLSFWPIERSVVDLPKDDFRHCSFKELEKQRTRSPWCHDGMMMLLSGYCNL